MRWTLRALRAALSLPARRLRAALARPDAAQRAVLDDVAADVRATAFGAEHGVTSAATFLDRVPPRTWDELAPWLDRQRAGEADVLTRRRVLFYEPTSGSSGPVKHVPYTAPLRRAFSRMFVVWVHDLLRNGPAFDRGRTWLSVSPRLHAPDTALVGMDSDADYLDGWVRRLVAPYVVDPPGAARAGDAETFWARLAEGLLDAGDLEAMSVWNPSMLTILLDRVEADRDGLAARLTGPRRRALLRDPVDWAGVWPALRLVSCWADGHAAAPAAALARRLPHATLQPKGLLATEGPVTVPLVGSPAGAPLVDSALIELLADDGALLPLTRAEEGATYELVLTYPGGLLRYRVGDRVTAVGRAGATPCLRFAGRTGGVSDLVGEKLNPAFVGEVLDALVGGHGFRTLVPLRRPVDRYALLLAEPAAPDLAERLDAALCGAHHYRHARQLGQLGAAEVRVSPAAPAAFLDAHTRRGARLGDVKPRALDPSPADDWVEALP